MEEPTKEEPTKFTQHLLNALIHFSYNFFVYFIFIVPFDLWKKATIRLSLQKEKGGLNISKINSPWPFFSFLKTFVLDFLLDGLTFFLYVVGLFIAILAWVMSGEFMSFVSTIVGIYFSPVFLSLMRDYLQLLILPIRKFLSWASKPAQFMDLEIKNK